MAELIKCNSGCTDRLLALLDSKNYSVRVTAALALLYSPEYLVALGILKELIIKYPIKHVLGKIFDGLTEFYDDNEEEYGRKILSKYKEILFKYLSHKQSIRKTIVCSAYYYFMYFFSVRDIISVKGSDVLYACSVYGAFKSLDRGVSWKCIYSGIVRDIVIDPKNFNCLSICSKLGIKTSMDGGANWHEPNLKIQDLIFDKFLQISDSDLYVIGNGGLYKKTLMHKAISCEQGSILRAGDTNFNRSVDNNNCWVEIEDGDFDFPDNCSTNIVIDSICSQIFYVGTDNGIFKSSDNGKEWIKIADIPSDDKFEILSIEPKISTTFFIGTPNKLYRSSDSGKKWSIVDIGLKKTTIERIIMHTNKPDIIFLSTWHGLLKSNDGGEKWFPVFEKLTGSRIDILSIDINSPDTIYAGMSEHLFKSDDSGESWSEINNKPYFCNPVDSIDLV